MNLTLEYHRSTARYFAGRTVTGAVHGARTAAAVAANLSPLRLITRPDPQLPEDGWTRVKPILSGICGSDLGLLTGRNSPYLSAVISLPFTPGHEVVGETLDDVPGIPRGSRVVLDPVPGCLPRGVDTCQWCDADQHSRCDHITTGVVSAGIQTGFCTDTSGGWSQMLVAHHSQLHVLPDGLDDRSAVMIEPLSCAIHTVRRVSVPDGASVLVVGAGTVGLLTVLALREYTKCGPIYVVARYPHQRERAREMGATEVLATNRPARALRRSTGAFLAHPERGDEYLLGGTDLAFECTAGSGLDTALRAVRAGGTVVLSGMPNAGVDLTPIWFRELQLVGAYASNGQDFPDAIALAQQAPLAGFVDAVYPLARWREAIGHASAAGRLGTIKVAFDPQKD